MDVAAVVVTYNRKTLLLQCLDALRAQSRPLQMTYVVDNASTDGSASALAAHDQTALTVISLTRNTGGAGGFRTGMQAAHERGHRWLWIMDDDCRPNPGALAELLAAYQRFPADMAPLILASKVEWRDGRVHPHNVVAVDSRDKDFLYICAGAGMLAIRAASFVSILVDRRAIDQHGLPLSAYFLYMDDIEWTSRVLRHGRGVLVPASVALHDTPEPSATMDATPPRFYLYLRNSLWMLLWSRSFSPREKLHRLALTALTTMRWLRSRWWRPGSWWTLLRAMLRSLLPPPDSTLTAPLPAR
jgi:rhamnopyranosyl-N-acetylglucosaminyl-diphospho-decaprenol beta-1,3/1,4-galactofuranosyltransferase